MPKKTSQADFESSLQSLEEILEKLEDGGLTLDESLKQYEKGVELSRRCQQMLEQAELKVREISGEPDDESDRE